MKRSYLSYSALKAFAKSPNHYLQYVSGERTESDAMKLGSLLHCMLLEPTEVDARFVQAPDVNLRTKAGKEEAAAFAEANAGKTVVKAEQWQLADTMRIAVQGHPLAFDLLKGLPEHKLEGDIEGVPFVGYADCLGEFVVDVKTTRDASPQGFKREASNFDYHLQAAIYKRLSGREFKWVAVENVAPFNVAVYTPSEEAMEAADAYLCNLVASWRVWDGAPAGYTLDDLELDLPPWHPAWSATRGYGASPRHNAPGIEDTNEFLNSL
jgi:hypothetical protein